MPGPGGAADAADPDRRATRRTQRAVEVSPDCVKIPIMKRVVLVVAGLMVAATVGFFVFAPGIVENDLNRVEGGELPEVTDATRQLHESLQVVDMHADTLLWDRS